MVNNTTSGSKRGRSEIPDEELIDSSEVEELRQQSYLEGSTVVQPHPQVDDNDTEMATVPERSLSFKSNDAIVDSIPGTVPSDETNTTQRPKYDPAAKALDVFSNPYFYEFQEYAERATRKRAAVLKDLTVGEVYWTFIHGHKESNEVALTDFAEMISALPSVIRRFFGPAEISVEQALAAKELIVLTGKEEVDIFKERIVADLPTLNGVWTIGTKKTSEGRVDRDLPLCFVLGPSGSGKTCFALDYFKEGFLKDPTKEHVSIYLHPSDFDSINWEGSNLDAATELIKKVMEKCSKIVGKKIKKQLKMHLTLILDEAGSRHTKHWFESRENLSFLCVQAGYVAEKVTIVVVGTGITGRSLKSTKDAYFFRMKGWHEGDLSKVLEKQKENPIAEKGKENVDTVAKTIVANHKLCPLASNARSAVFLLDAILQLSKGCTRSSWEMQLDEWTPPLVTQVVNKYIATNGLAGLDATQRRRVAAFVFHAMQELKEGDPTLPTFEGLEPVERQAAESLLQFNVEKSYGDELEIIQGEKFAFTVSPAIAMILYSLAGVYATLLPGWKNEQEIAALYMVRQLILQCMQRYFSDENIEGRLDRLDEALEKIRLLRLQKRLQSKHDKVYVPMVDCSTVIMNGDNASFADVIGPYTLMQAKRTKNKTSNVNLYDEVKKCGLLKGNSDDRLLQGLVAMWQGAAGMGKGSSQFVSLPPKVKRNPQFSKAFPESLLSLVPPSDRIRFAAIPRTDSTNMTMDDGTPVILPVLDQVTDTIIFIISTNADTLNLKLQPSNTEERKKWKSDKPSPTANADTLDSELGKIQGTTTESKLGGSTPNYVVISETDLNDDMEIVINRLKDPAAKQAWSTFLNDNIRRGVKLKFLFTT